MIVPAKPDTAFGPVLSSSRDDDFVARYFIKHVGRTCSTRRSQRAVRIALRGHELLVCLEEILGSYLTVDRFRQVRTCRHEGNHAHGHTHGED